MERNDNGTVKKGTVLNPTGRPKGAKNKVQAEVKNKLQQIIENNIQRIESDLEELEAKDRLNVLIRLLEYIVPKEKEMKIDFSSLSDQEIDELIKRITDEANRQN